MADRASDLRIGIVGRLVGSPDSWSGTPSGLADGLSRLGYTPLFLSAELSADSTRLVRRWLRATGRLDPSEQQSPEAIVLRSLIARVRRLRLGALRGTKHWVQMGSEFGSPVRGFVTFEDMTVAQAVRLADYVPLRPPVARAWIRRQQAIYRRAQICCVASRWTRDSIVNDYQVEPTKVRVVGCGCNIQVEVQGRDWSVPRFLFVSLDWSRKGGDAVVAAFAKLRAELPRAELSLVGDHPRLDVPGVTGHGRLHLTNRVDRSAFEGLLTKSTCFVLPSRYEPFGIAYVEAGWAGIASIGTTVGGASSAIGPGGVLVDPSSPDQLLHAMKALSRPDTARELGIRAHDHARLLSWDLVARRVAGALGLMGEDLEPDLPDSVPTELSQL